MTVLSPPDDRCSAGRAAADVPGDGRCGSRPEIFHRSGSTLDQAAAGARASTAAYEQRSGVGCVERTLATAWNWDLEYWEADLLAVCDFG
jgi:hypothetical protein